MKFSKLLLVFLFLGVALQGRANHLVGGEFRMSYLNNFTYDIQLHVYGDNANLGAGNEDTFVEVSTFNKRTNQLIEVFRLNLAGTGFVPYVNKACQTGSITTKVLAYQATKVLPPSIYNSPDGYYLVWERCCRNNGIVNIQSPGQTGLVYYAEFPAVVKNNVPYINSSPVLPPMPPDFLCVGSLYQYSMKATDPDGDKLVYTLSDPMAGHTTSDPQSVRTPGLPGPYRLVTWNNNFNTANQIPGNPSLNIDANTGLLSVNPRFAGLFVFAITVSEYRNGVKIGEVRRDIQVKVNACPTNSKPVVSLRAPGANQDYQAGDTLVVTDATNFCFPIKISDATGGQTLTLKAISKNFTGNLVVSPTSVSIQQPGQIVNGQLCWPDCNINSPNQLFFADLVISDNACGNPSSDTLHLTFRVIPTKNDKPVIKVLGADPNNVVATIGQPLNFTVVSTDSADMDDLTVSMTGTGFDPKASNMQFAPVNGKGQVISTFSWTPDCSHLQRSANYELVFSVRDNSCYMDHETNVKVNLKLKDVKDSVAFSAPNIFTPNNDGKNDFFIVPGLPLDVCSDSFQEIKIYSRWGTEVFSSKSRQFAWDGKNVSDGVYFYLVRFNKRKYKGWVEVVR